MSNVDSFTAGTGKRNSVFYLCSGQPVIQTSVQLIALRTKSGWNRGYCMASSEGLLLAFSGLDDWFPFFALALGFDIHHPLYRHQAEHNHLTFVFFPELVVQSLSTLNQLIQQSPPTASRAQARFTNLQTRFKMCSRVTTASCTDPGQPGKNPCTPLHCKASPMFLQVLTSSTVQTRRSWLHQWNRTVEPQRSRDIPGCELGLASKIFW